MVTMTNNRLYKRFCEDVLERPDLFDDPRFVDNAARVENREALTDELNSVLMADTRSNWITKLSAEVFPAASSRRRTGTDVG